MRRLVIIALAVAFLLPSVAVRARAFEVTRDDIAGADERRRELQAGLASVTARYDAALAREAELQDELRRLAVEFSAVQQDLAATRIEAREVVRELYMNAGSTGVAMFFEVRDFVDLPVRASYLDLVTSADVAALNRLEALEASYVDQQARLESATEEQAVIAQDIEALATEILERLREADAEYQAVVAAWERQEEERRRREEEEARRRAEEEARRAFLATSTTTTTTTTTTLPASTTTAPTAGSSTTTTQATTTTVAASTTTTTTTPPPPPGMVCPVDGAVTFVDTWGAPRSGGRTHQGVDMIAARGTPIVAIEAGTVRRMGNGGLGGITVWLRGASGDEYYYAHLDGWADGLFVGQQVQVGELLGYNGNTGNARYTIPHLHFELHPGGGAAVNPFPLVDELCN